MCAVTEHILFKGHPIWQSWAQLVGTVWRRHLHSPCCWVFIQTTLQGMKPSSGHKSLWRWQCGAQPANSLFLYNQFGRRNVSYGGLNTTLLPPIESKLKNNSPGEKNKASLTIHTERKKCWLTFWIDFSDPIFLNFCFPSLYILHIHPIYFSSCLFSLLFSLLIILLFINQLLTLSHLIIFKFLIFLISILALVFLSLACV
jgi:hypothetical protein